MVPSGMSCATSSPPHRRSTAAHDEQSRHQPSLPQVVLPGNQRTRLRCPGATQHTAAHTPPVLVVPPLQSRHRGEQQLRWPPPPKFWPSPVPLPPQRKAPGTSRSTVRHAWP
ncbi:hypothetical protein PVAP13_6KG200012 [Panicum virgatum]|uniref:Uncharacterized protein n=1 Tax=Panicum virgatum TaxID=38727 RepID=A0A8T0RDD2_PANVG|nr:hypothetical protein PVAP13_6KG200012 [Panicum virgatum]